MCGFRVNLGPHGQHEQEEARRQQEEEDERDDSTPRVYLRERGQKRNLYKPKTLRLSSLLKQKLSDPGVHNQKAQSQAVRPQRSQGQEEVQTPRSLTLLRLFWRLQTFCNVGVNAAGFAGLRAFPTIESLAAAMETFKFKVLPRRLEFVNHPAAPSDPTFCL